VKRAQTCYDRLVMLRDLHDQSRLVSLSDRLVYKLPMREILGRVRLRNEGKIRIESRIKTILPTLKLSHDMEVLPR